MYKPSVNSYNPKTLVLKAQTLRKRELMNVANKKRFLLRESSCTYFNMYVCIQSRIYYIPEITISLNMQIITLKSFGKIYTRTTNMVAEQ